MNKELFSLYEELYNLHVGTKTNDTVYHSASASLYEDLFNVVHSVDEAMQDSKQESPVDPKMARKRTYEIIEKAKSIVEGLVNSNKDMAVDNVLRGLVDKLGFDCGNARALIAWCSMKWGEDKLEEPVEEPTEEPEEEAEEDTEEEDKGELAEEEYEEDLMSESMKGQDSGYTYSSKEEDEKDKKKNKMKGSSEYTVVSIMP